MLDLAGILRNAKSGTQAKPTVVRLHAGIYAGDVVLASKEWLSLQPFGDGPVAIQGGNNYCLKLDHCNNIGVQGISFAKSRNWGLMATFCKELLWVDLVSDGNEDNGFLTSNVFGITVRNCKGRNSATGHGLYFSEHGGDYKVEGGEFSGNARCGIQVNAHPGGATGLEIHDADVTKNRNAAIQCAGVTKAVIGRNNTKGSRQGVVLWDDKGGVKYGCHDFDLLQQMGPFSIAHPPICTEIHLPKGASTSYP